MQDDSYVGSEKEGVARREREGAGAGWAREAGAGASCSAGASGTLSVNYFTDSKTLATRTWFLSCFERLAEVHRLRQALPPRPHPQPPLASLRGPRAGRVGEGLPHPRQ